MAEWYRVFSDLENCRIIAMIFLGVVSLIPIFHIFKNASLTGRHLSAPENVIVYFFGLIAFLSGNLTLGLLILTDNAFSLMEALGIAKLQTDFTRQVQAFILYLLRLLY